MRDDRYELMLAVATATVYATLFGLILTGYGDKWLRYVRTQLLKIRMAAIRLDFPGFSNLGVLNMAKKSDMSKDMIKSLLYGAIVEMQDSRNYYIRSSVGPEYSSWTEEGQQQLSNLMAIISQQVDLYEREQLKLRSQQYMLAELKKDHE